MSTPEATDERGGTGRDMRRVHAGHKRWIRQQNRQKKRELLAQLAEARRRHKAEFHAYMKAYGRACAVPECRGLDAINAAWDEADRAMARLLATRASVSQLEAKVRSATS